MLAAVTRWEPFAELGELGGREGAWTPAIDAERDNVNLVVRADAPGIKPEEKKVEIKATAA